MTPSLADKTSTSVKVLRRHTDPPSLWIAVTIGSVALHLLAFWLIRSYQSSLLWQKQSNASIPIEFVEIASPKKSTPKPRPQVQPAASQPKTVSPKPPSPKQQLPPKNLPTPVATPDKLTTQVNPTVEEKNALALAEQRQREIAAQRQREIAEQRQREIAEQRQREIAEQRQREIAAQRQREIAEQRQREIAAQRQQEIAAQQQREIAAQQQREIAAQQQREIAAQRQQEIAAQQQREIAEQQQGENIPTNNQKFPPPPSAVAGGSLVASLVGEPQQGIIDRRTHPAQIKPSNQPFSRGLEYVKYIEKKPGEPVELTVELTISETGKLENVLVADDAIPAREKSYYQEFLANEVFNGWEFEPGYDNDPSDRKPSNLIVRIRIEPLP
jgi:hypothetical protein